MSASFPSIDRQSGSSVSGSPGSRPSLNTQSAALDYYGICDRIARETGGGESTVEPTDSLWTVTPTDIPQIQRVLAPRKKRADRLILLRGLRNGQLCAGRSRCR